MSLSAKIREQIIASFRAELAEHVQTMNDGLLSIEQHRVAAGDRGPLLEEVLRAAHSLKGAARAIGVTAVEQLSHALEDVMSALQDPGFSPSPDLFTACYAALDAIQEVQVAYESGETTPPTQALRALTNLEPFRSSHKPVSPKTRAEQASPEQRITEAQPDEAPDGHEPSAEPTVLATPVPVSGADETIRVTVSKLDGLMAQLSELLVTRIRAEERRTQIRKVHDFINEWQRDWYTVRGLYSRLLRKQRGANGDSAAPPDRDLMRLMGYLEVNQARLRELGALVTGLSRSYDSDLTYTSQVVDALEEEIKHIRMMPLHTITTSFGRMVRDLAQSEGKEVLLEIAGADVELDKRVLEQIKNPLVHLLRNAVDHGIESPAARQAAGKPRRGHLLIRAEQVGKEVIVTVSDDGAGLDLDSIRQVAARRSEGAAELQGLNERELVDRIFDTGFTTSPMITDISGRGIGLDVVRRNVDMLGGSVNVEWGPGRGTTFRLTLPLTLTSSRALLVLTSDQVFAIPLSAVERILYVTPDRIVPLGGHESVQYAGKPVTIVRLSSVLEMPDTAGDGDHISIVILTVGERRLGFVVDELLGEQEVVIKSLGRQLSHIGGITGGTVMGNGEVVLILNPGDLMKLALRGAPRPVLQGASSASQLLTAPAQPRILIVDDSVTTRTLEKNILEASGFEVEIATNGEEALNAIVVHGRPDLIISDISMPRLDGFGLTERIKSDPHTAGIPVILVTSLDSVEDKSRGIEVGADAYIVKSRFDQTSLLETIKQLI